MSRSRRRVIARLQEARLAALEDRIDADLVLGRARARWSASSRRSSREHPLRERLLGQLMLALYRSGRQADALERYREGRGERSIDELGIEPGPELRAARTSDPHARPRAQGRPGGSVREPSDAHGRARRGGR